MYGGLLQEKICIPARSRRDLGYLAVTSPAMPSSSCGAAADPLLAYAHAIAASWCGPRRRARQPQGTKTVLRSVFGAAREYNGEEGSEDSGRESETRVLSSAGWET